jgi:hypothetical protein
MLSAKTPSPVQCPPRGLHREQTLGEGFGERKGSFAERNPTLGEDLESGSDPVLKGLYEPPVLK